MSKLMEDAEMDGKMWIALIESKREELTKAIEEAYMSMCDENETSSYHQAVILYDDGDVDTCYRDQNTWGQCEQDNTAICICKIKAHVPEEMRLDWQQSCEKEGVENWLDEMKAFIATDFPINADEKIDECIAELE